MSEKIRHKNDGQDANKSNQRTDENKELSAQTGHKNEGPLDHLNRDDFDSDLRSKEGLGGHSVLNPEHDSEGLRRAYDDKALVDMLQEFNNDELKSIVILPTGTKLEQGGTYIDLNDPDRLEIIASGVNPVTPHLEAQEGQKLVPKSQLDFELWDRLTGKGDRVNAD